jgi:hypothetical protein
MVLAPPRLLPALQVVCAVTLALLIAADAPTTWAFPVLLVLLVAVWRGEGDEPDAEMDARMAAVGEDAGSPDLRLAVAMAVVLHLAVLAGIVVVLVAERCTALVGPFAVAVGAFGALRLHVAGVLAR